MTNETVQLELLPSSKERLKEAVAVIAKRWPPYDERYDEESFFADIDSGKIFSEKQIDDIFMTARALLL